MEANGKTREVKVTKRKSKSKKKWKPYPKWVRS